MRLKGDPSRKLERRTPLYLAGCAFAIFLEFCYLDALAVSRFVSGFV